MMILIRNCCLFHFLTVLSHIVKFLSMNNFKEYFLHYFLSRIRMLKPDSDPEKFENRNGTRPGSGSETLGTYQLKQSQVTCKKVFLKITSEILGTSQFKQPQVSHYIIHRPSIRCDSMLIEHISVSLG